MASGRTTPTQTCPRSFFRSANGSPNCGRCTTVGGTPSAPPRTPRRRRALGRRLPFRAGAAALAPSMSPDTARVRWRRRSLASRPRLDLGDEVLQRKAARRLDLADLRQEVVLVERLPRPLQHLRRDALAG